MIAGVSALLLVNPADDADNVNTKSADGYTTREMLGTPQFGLLWLMLFLNVTAGILLISNAVPLMQELTGSAPAEAAALYGGVALFNAFGRLFWGALSDRIGRSRTFALIFAIQSMVFVLLGEVHGVVAVSIAYAVVLFCFGGGFGTMPSFVADYFGTPNLGANYGVILSAWGIAGVVGPLFAAQVKDATGSYGGTLLPVAVMLLLAILLPMITRKPGAFSAVTRGYRALPMVLEHGVRH